MPVCGPHGSKLALSIEVLQPNLSSIAKPAKPCAPAPKAVITVLDLQNFHPNKQVAPVLWEVNQSTGTDILSPGNSTTPNTGTGLQEHQVQAVYQYF